MTPTLKDWGHLLWSIKRNMGLKYVDQIFYQLFNLFLCSLLIMDDLRLLLGNRTLGFKYNL